MDGDEAPFQLGLRDFLDLQAANYLAASVVTVSKLVLKILKSQKYAIDIDLKGFF